MDIAKEKWATVCGEEFWWVNNGDNIPIVKVLDNPYDRDIARLIAAAPVLYKALKGILNLAEGYADMPQDLIVKTLLPILAEAEGN